MRRVIAVACVALLALGSAARAAHPWFDLYVEQSNRPAGKLVRGVAANALLGSVKTNPVGWMASAAWKVSDLTLKLGEAGLRGEDDSRGALILSTNADALLLKTLHDDEHVDLNSDPRAIAAKQRLRAAGDEMSASGLSSTEYLLAVTNRHLTYAVSRVAAEEFASWGLGKLYALGPERWLHGTKWPGRKIAGMVDSQGRFRNQLRSQGWGRLGLRAAAAQAATEKYAKKLHDFAADKIVDAFFDAEGHDGIDILCRRLRCDDPSRPIFRPTLRLELTRLELPALPMPAPPVRAQAVAAPAAIPVIRAYLAPFPVAAATAGPPTDPVEIVINREDRLTWQSRHADISSTPAPPPAEHETVAEPPSAAQIERRHHWDCAGAGFSKAGCGDVNWDGRRQQ